MIKKGSIKDWWLVFLVIILSLSPNISYGMELDKIINKVQEIYDSTDTMEADFEQENILVNRSDKIEAKGKVFFKKPGMMRWDYEMPVKQRIMSDGKTLWIYQPQFNQVMVSPVSEREAGIGHDFLSGIGKLREDFLIRLEGEEDASYILNLEARKKGLNIEKVILRIGKEDFLVNESQVYDPFGNVTKIRFDKIKINPSLPITHFQFEIPKGVKVVTP